MEEFPTQSKRRVILWDEDTEDETETLRMTVNYLYTNFISYIKTSHQFK
jgi:hypothetical protein